MDLHETKMPTAKLPDFWPKTLSLDGVLAFHKDLKTACKPQFSRIGKLKCQAKEATDEPSIGAMSESEQNLWHAVNE